MKIAALVQARMGSSRLPKKTLMDLMGIPMIQHTISRLRRCENLNQIILCTTDKQQDNELVKFCKINSLDYFRGSESDVLDRYYNAAKIYDVDIVVRITGDCPVIDPRLVDEVIQYYMDHDYDYVALDETFPDGLDTEVFSIAALKMAWENATRGSEREHVTPYIKNQNTMKSYWLTNDVNLNNYRWTVDELADFNFIKEIFSFLYPNNHYFNRFDIINLLRDKPELMEINGSIVRNEGYLKSLKNDLSSK